MSTQLEDELFEFLKHGDEEHQRWLHEAIHAYFDNKPRPEPAQVVDLDKEFYAELNKAAKESNWVPEEYFVNDWVSDAANFLRTGNGIYDNDTLDFISYSIRALERDFATPRMENTIRQLKNLAFELSARIRGDTAMQKAQSST